MIQDAISPDWLESDDFCSVNYKHTHIIYMYNVCVCVTVYINSVFQLPSYNKIHFSDNFIFEFSQILTETWLEYLHNPLLYLQ
jgi:hypothetical protein